MEDENKVAEQKSAQTQKAIGDLDDLVKAVRGSLPSTKPWQRQLLAHLSEVDRCAQVLRMTISMSRASCEVVEATERLRFALRVSQRYVSTGRADLGTRAAVLLAFELGSKIEAALT